jgi:hypothetical protein
LNEPDFVEKLKPIMRAHKWIWDSMRELSPELRNGYSNLADFLAADPKNLLSKAEEYSVHSNYLNIFINN